MVWCQGPRFGSYVRASGLSFGFARSFCRVQRRRTAQQRQNQAASGATPIAPTPNLSIIIGA